MILYSKLFWEIFYTHHLKNWKIIHFLRRATRMCVCVVWRGIIHGVQTFILKNWSSSPNRTCKYKTADRKHLLVAIGFFYIYIYIYKYIFTVESVLWTGMFKKKKKKKVCLFLTKSEWNNEWQRGWNQQNFALTETVWTWICLEESIRWL